MVSRNKYAFCRDKRNLSSAPSGKGDSKSLSCGGRANAVPGIAATPAAATAAAPASKSLRLENRMELIGDLLLAAVVPLRARGRKDARVDYQSGRIIVFPCVCCQHLQCGSLA